MLFESRHWERNKSAPALIVTRFIVLWLMEGGGGGVLWVAWWLWRCLWPSNSRAPGFAGDTEWLDHQQWSGIVSAAENTKIQRSWCPSGKDTAARNLESKWTWWKARNNLEIRKKQELRLVQRLLKARKNHENLYIETTKTPHQSTICTISIMRFIKRFPISGCSA